MTKKAATDITIGCCFFRWANVYTPFCDNLGESISKVFNHFNKHFTFDGEALKDQRVYYFNTQELLINRSRTQSLVPFLVIDNNVRLDIDISIRCCGEYSYKITNFILFYTNVCGNIESQLRAKVMAARQPSFAQIAQMGIRDLAT